MPHLYMSSIFHNSPKVVIFLLLFIFSIPFLPRAFFFSYITSWVIYRPSTFHVTSQANPITFPSCLLRFRPRNSFLPSLTSLARMGIALLWSFHHSSASLCLGSGNTGGASIPGLQLMSGRCVDAEGNGGRYSDVTLGVCAEGRG